MAFGNQRRDLRMRIRQGAGAHQCQRQQLVRSERQLLVWQILQDIDRSQRIAGRDQTACSGEIRIIRSLRRT